MSTRRNSQPLLPFANNPEAIIWASNAAKRSTAHLASPSSAISSSSCVFRVSSCGLPSLASHTTSPPSGKRPPILLTPPQYGITPFYPSNSIPSSFLCAPHARRGVPFTFQMPRSFT
ncbi:hypothetical protein PCASD_07558 [Puccinia coronata f. sp. avenae]|uniref:Uncharacterized protein n=1 Tax=Puccinia coronata f. sp. avenae TaxID=200324 RepID=A0A2N5TGU0_9BASI|nr:hypothetical protein PCASD_07558 [Puccinia coronata f. sp. avenae]